MYSFFETKFNKNVNDLKKWVNGLRQYNKVLEQVYITMLEEIKTKFLGKKIDKRFSTHILKCLGSNEHQHYILVKHHELSYQSYKTINVNLPNYTIYETYVRVLCTSVVTANNITHFDNSVMQAIVKAINTNRQRVARFEDAAKNADKQLKHLEKIISDFRSEMAKINPIFIGTYTLNFDIEDYVNKINDKVELFEYNE